MERLYPHELRYIHDTMLELYGGLAGEKDPGMIDYVCEKPFLIVFGYEKYPDLFEKAAVIMFTLARGHYFFDGNKRTALMSTYTFLMKNGYELIVSNETLFEMCIAVATGKKNEQELAAWLKSISYSVNNDK
jgi:death-on-curing protein